MVSANAAVSAVNVVATFGSMHNLLIKRTCVLCFVSVSSVVVFFGMLEAVLRRVSLTQTFVAALGLAVATSACGGGSTGTTTAPVPTATKNQINAMPRDKVQDGGTFTWPLTQMVTNFNYNQLDGAQVDAAQVISALMPTTYTSDAVGAPIWNKDYLASEPALTANPKQVVTFDINPKAVWYDGTPITWEDFYWQWRANNGTDKAYQIASANGYEDIESVQKGKDDREVIVTFKHKYADWPSVFYLFYPASTNKNPKTFNEGWTQGALTTAGPFRIESIDLTSKTITMVRNEKWWGDRAKLDKIVFRVISPDAEIDALANGEIDSMDVGADANKYNRVKDIANVEMRVAGGPNFRHLTINGTGQNLQDVKVRQAIAMAIDRTAIARALLGPLGINVQPLNNHIFMSNQLGYRDNSGDVGKYDPAKAKDILDAAGWKLDGNVRKKDGRPLEITCVIPTAVATSRQESELIQNMLGQVGVTMRIDTVPGDDFFAKYLTPGQFDFTVFSWFGTPYPVSSSKSIYVKPTKDAKGALDIHQNVSRIGSDEIDHLFDQAIQELDPKKAIDLANQIDALIWQEVHSLTLYQRPELFATKKTLANFGAFGFVAPWVYQDIGWAKP
jgi:peptide/nickel transport system substrate-binding protein